jgi:predicted aspartyl protease
MSAHINIDNEDYDESMKLMNALHSTMITLSKLKIFTLPKQINPKTGEIEKPKFLKSRSKK